MNFSFVTKAVNVAVKWTKYHAPEILTAGGIISSVAAVVSASKAGIKASDIIKESEEIKEKLANIEATMEKNGEIVDNDGTVIYNFEDLKKDVRTAKINLAWKMFKCYAKTIGLEVMSIVCSVGSSKIYRRRYTKAMEEIAKLSIAFTSLESAFREYRERVKDKYGTEVEHDILMNAQEEVTDETIVTKSGKEKTVTNKIKKYDPNNTSIYARIYDSGNIGWTKNAQDNKFFLLNIQKEFNRKLHNIDPKTGIGYVLLADVYKALGYSVTELSLRAGWIYDPNNPDHCSDDCIDFGLEDVNNPATARFYNEEETNVLLDFNCDSDVYAYFHDHNMSKLNQYGSGNKYRDMMDYSINFAV